MALDLQKLTLPHLIIMIVFPFWLWHMASWMMCVKAVPWTPFCKISLFSKFMTFGVGCLNAFMYFGSVGLEGACWGLLLYAYYDIRDVITVIPIWYSSLLCALLMLWCMVSGVTWFFSHILCPLALRLNSLTHPLIWFLIVDVVVNWLDFPLFTILTTYGKVCWNVLMPVCNDHSNDNDEFNIYLGLALHFFTFTTLCLVHLYWQSLCSHCSILFGKMSLHWLVLITMVFGCLFLYLLLLWMGFLSTPTPFTFLCFWWQVSISLSSQLQYLRGLHPLSMAQHVYMLCLHLWMLGHPFFGGWFTPWLMLLFSSKCDVGFVSCLFWTFLSLWLSLPLASKIAPTLVGLHTSVCWQLDHGQKGREEVRGKSSSVYDEIHSETKMSIFFNEPWIEISFSWWLSFGLHLCSCWPKLKVEMSFATHWFAPRMKISKIGQNIQSLKSDFELWCINVFVPVCVYPNHKGTIICIIGLFIMLKVFPGLYLFGRAGFGLPRYFVLA